MRFQIALLAVFLFSGTGIFLPSSSAQTTSARVIALKTPAPVVSENFVVHATDPTLARKVSSEAERFRKELALQWLGRELEPWDQKCPITVEVGMHAGGETSFAFIMDNSGRGKPVDWQMKIYGSYERLLDAVLPHEVTHTIFATHFGRPLPRWADEGACTTVEHVSERRKNHKMLMDFLTSKPSRGIPFNRMFTMRNYPHDILPLYAQGYSLAKFLIAQKGPRHFLNFVGKGMQNESQLPVLKAWDQATNEFYDYRDLSDLQISWLGWVRNGSSESNPENLAKAQPQTMGQPQSIYAAKSSNSKSPKVMAATFTSEGSGSWYAREMQKGNRVTANWQEQEKSKPNKNPVRSEIQNDAGYQNDSPLPTDRQSGSSTIWR